MKKMLKKIVTIILLSGLFVVVGAGSDMLVVNATEMAETEEDILEVEGLGKITTDTLNVRSGPGTDYSTLGKVYSTDTVRIIGQLESWYKIVYDGTEGYVSADYVEVISLDVVEEETSTELVSSEEEPVVEEAANGKRPILLIVVIAIIVVCIMLVGTVIALKTQSDDNDEEDFDDEDDYEEDDYEEDAYEEDVYEEDEYDENDKVEPMSKDEGFTVDNFDEVKYVEQENTDSDDYRIHIDPDFFDNIRNN